MPFSYATHAMRSVFFAVTRLDGYAGLRNCAIVGFACANSCGASATESDTTANRLTRRILCLETGRWVIISQRLGVATRENNMLPAKRTPVTLPAPSGSNV